MKHMFMVILACAGVMLVQNGVAAQSKTAVKKGSAKASWEPLFDGKTLSGWEAFDKGRWRMTAEGVLVGEGPMGHLFSPKAYKNVQFKAEAKLNHSGNSGMYFRAKKGPGWPVGYEAQVENTSPDPQKTGSLYNFSKVTEQLIQDDTWWTQEITAIGNRIIIKVNGKVVVDFTDAKNTHTEGHLAFQQHNDGSVVMFRNAQVRELPDDEKASWKIVDKGNSGGSKKK